MKTTLVDAGAVLKKLEAALVVVRELDREMPAQSLAALVFVARNPGCTSGDIESELDLGAGAASRMTARFGEYERPGKKGSNLLVNNINPADRRLRQIYLTPRGQEFLRQVVAALA